MKKDFTKRCVPGTLRGPEKDKWAVGLLEKLEKLNSTRDYWIERKQAITRDKKLSEVGKQEPLKKVIEQAEDEIKKEWPENLDDYRKQWESKVYEPPTYGQSDVAGMLRLREIRDRFYAISDITDRARLYSEANARGDMEVIEAVEGAPSAFPIVNQQRIDLERGRRLEKKFPEPLAALADLDHYGNLLGVCIRDAIREVKEAV
jgi:hypothetical protein